MSDCRFGVSPVNYPDPDPDHQSWTILHDIQSTANAKKKSIVSLVKKKIHVHVLCHPTLFKPVSVLLEVRFGIFVSTFRSVLVRFGPFRSVSVNRDTAHTVPRQS